jgi:hypothetical protein
MNVQRTFVTATLLWLSMGFSSLVQATVCDVDTNGVVDRLDLSLIISARDTPAGGPDDPRDADGDGTITVLDVRTCIRQCNVPGCAIIDPAPPPPSDDSGQFDAPDATPNQKAVKDVSKSGEATTDQLSIDVQGRTIVSSTEWKVTRGDTLYAIGRAVYPGDARKQARLRRDIMQLNPSVFANGANNMAIGTVLKLPDYVAPKSTPSQVGEPAQVPAPVPATVTPSPAPQPAASTPVVKPEPESQAKKEPSAVNEQSASYPFAGEGNFLVSLGYSYGGDKLVNEDGSYDPAGAGGHLRLGYEQMFQNVGGYRIALGLQYGLADDGGDTSFRDTYLQLAYQYRANPFVYGIGVVFSEGATLKNDSTTDYDAAIGAVVYLENVGSSVLAGWGLSYTSLEIEEQNTSTSFDVSRAELYYSWRF